MGRLNDRIERRAKQVKGMLNSCTVARREQVEQQAMQDGERQGGGCLPATAVCYRMPFITTGRLTPAVAGCMPASAVSSGLINEQANDERQPLGDAVPGKARPGPVLAPQRPAAVFEEHALHVGLPGIGQPVPELRYRASARLWVLVEPASGQGHLLSF